MNIFIDRKFETAYVDHPITLVDVGSSGGLQDNWKEAERFLKVIGFDADSRSHEENSQNPKYINLEYGLNNKKGEADFYLTRSKTKSSLYEPNFDFLSKFPKSDFYEVIGKSVIKCDTLDNQLSGLDIQDVDFIKLDTQGSELAILEGSEKALASSVFGVEVETEFAPMYKNQPLFPEIDSFMRKFGFQLFDLAPCYWKRKAGRPLGGPQGQLIYADALYLKSGTNLKFIIDSFSGAELKKSKVLRVLSICFLYGYFDYALEIFDEFKNLFDKTEAKTIDVYIRIDGQKYQNSLKFPGQKYASPLLYRLWKFLKPRDYNWKRYIYKPGNRGGEFISQ